MFMQYVLPLPRSCGVDDDRLDAHVAAVGRGRTGAAKRRAAYADLVDLRRCDPARSCLIWR
jgi:hypothetical protein